MDKELHELVRAVAVTARRGLLVAVAVVAGCEAGHVAAAVESSAPADLAGGSGAPARSIAELVAEDELVRDDGSPAAEATSRVPRAALAASTRWARPQTPRRTATAAPTTIPGTTRCAQTHDGIPAYGYQSCASPGGGDVYSDRNGVNTSRTPRTAWKRTEGGFGYQCLELATRYFYARHNIDPIWGVQTASQMCATHPGRVSVVSLPKPGDLMVFIPGTPARGKQPARLSKCGIADAGHVAVVDQVPGNGSISVVQQNPAKKLSWPGSCALCYLRAR